MFLVTLGISKIKKKSVIHNFFPDHHQVFEYSSKNKDMGDT